MLLNRHIFTVALRPAGGSWMEVLASCAYYCMKLGTCTSKYSNKIIIWAMRLAAALQSTVCGDGVMTRAGHILTRACPLYPGLSEGWQLTSLCPLVAELRSWL